MQMDAEKRNKVILGGLIICVVLYGLWTYFVEPTSKSLVSSEAAITQIQTDLRKAKATISRIDELGKKLAAAAELESKMFSGQPEGAPVAWLPPRLEAFFARQGVRCVAKSSGDPKPLSPDAAELQVYSWMVEFTRVDFLKFGAALAAFETSQPLFVISEVQINHSPDEPEFQNVTLQIQNIIKRTK